MKDTTKKALCYLKEWHSTLSKAELAEIKEDREVNQFLSDPNNILKLIGAIRKASEETCATTQSIKLIDGYLEQLKKSKGDEKNAYKDKSKQCKSALKRIDKKIDMLTTEKNRIIYESIIDKADIILEQSDSPASANAIQKCEIKSGNGSSYPFNKYLKNILKYQLEFYRLSDNIDGRKMSIYEYMVTDDYFEFINEIIQGNETIKFTFEYNMFKPLQLSIDELDEFKCNIEYFMEFCFRYLLKNSPYYIRLDAIRDDEGRVKDKNNPDAIFARWQKYIDAYKYHKDGMSNMDIYSILEKGSKVKVNSKYHKIDSYLRSAKKLIRAAEDGTFPFDV